MMLGVKARRLLCNVTGRHCCLGWGEKLPQNGRRQRRPRVSVREVAGRCAAPGGQAATCPAQPHRDPIAVDMHIYPYTLYSKKEKKSISAHAKLCLFIRDVWVWHENKPSVLLHGEHLLRKSLGIKTEMHKIKQ